MKVRRNWRNLLRKASPEGKHASAKNLTNQGKGGGGIKGREKVRFLGSLDERDKCPGYSKKYNQRRGGSLGVGG